MRGMIRKGKRSTKIRSLMLLLLSLVWVILLVFVVGVLQ